MVAISHGAIRSFFMKLITFGTSTVHATEIGLYPDHAFSEFHLHHSGSNQDQLLNMLKLIYHLK
jgi:hypothetical protein